MTTSHFSLMAHILQAQDTERRRISRDLHDGVGQILAVLKMELVQAAQLGDHTVATKLQECMRLTDETIREVRAVSFLLHPPILDLLGLIPAIREYAEGFAKRSDIGVCIEISEDLTHLSANKETALFRVVQESLTNVHRHSKAKNVWIRAKPDHRNFRLEVEDNGHGIANFNLENTPEALTRMGVGIAGMRERLWEVGGQLDIRSGPGGTLITASIPSTKL